MIRRDGEHAQFDAWNGDEGDHWIIHRQRYDTMLRGLTPRIIETSALSSDAAVLDIGCGCGELARLIALEAKDGETIGMDLSAPMLAVARRLAVEEGIANVTFIEGDVEVHPFAPAHFDAAVSRLGTPFFEQPVAAFANVRRALRPGGTLVFACWQDLLLNEWVTVPAAAAMEHVAMPTLTGDASTPFSLADPARIEHLLSAAGFVDIAVTDVAEPVLLGGDANEVTRFMAGTGIARALLGQLDLDTVRQVLLEIRRALTAHEGPDGIWLGSRSWLVTARTRGG